MNEQKCKKKKKHDKNTSKIMNISSELTNLSALFRCGALTVGDQILSIDETIIENTSYTPEDVMSFLNGPSDRGFTQIQILPVHAINRKGS